MPRLLPAREEASDPLAGQFPPITPGAPLAGTGPDIRLLQKRDKVAALDLRFQRYRKAEP